VSNSKTRKIELEQSWLDELLPEFQKNYMLSLRSFLIEEKKNGKKIFPKGNEIFNALDSTPLHKVKVVIIGQDPYYGLGQAHGLCFSVPERIKIPPSLINIFRELKTDLGLSPPANGCLLPWAKQGILLLNSVLSVEQGLPGSHASMGWERFTDSVISKVNERDSIVFMLWGSYALQKGKSIDASKHLVLKSAHPSPLSAHKGFFGNKHFSQCNTFLQEKGKAPISWEI